MRMVASRRSIGDALLSGRGPVAMAPDSVGQSRGHRNRSPRGLASTRKSSLTLLSYFLLSGVGQDDGSGGDEQRDAERRGEPASARQILLRRHHRGEREHPAEAPGAD